MMRRGLKRKLDKILDNFEEEPDPYQQGLGDFQSAVRKRESMRIKNQVFLFYTDLIPQTWSDWLWKSFSKQYWFLNFITLKWIDFILF